MQIPEIETGIPYADYPPTFETLAERVNAAFNSLAEIYDEGVDVTDEDISAARGLFTGRVKPTSVDLSSPGTVIHLKAILDEYDRTVVQSAAQLRRYVTNKLVAESANPDARIRMKSLELLGKISDVGLFTDKTEITLKHRPTEELEQLLRERLMKTIDAEPAKPEAKAVISRYDDELLEGKDDSAGA
jgi:hypothetical protein